MLKVEPFRLTGMEILSTALWHLRRDKDLAALAMQVGDFVCCVMLLICYGHMMKLELNTLVFTFVSRH